MSGSIRPSSSHFSRRRVLQSLFALTALGLTACSQPPPAPATPPPVAKPTAAPTQPAPAAKPAAPTPPAAQPAAQATAATKAPAKLSAPVVWRHSIPDIKFDSAFKLMGQEKGYFSALNVDLKVTPVASGTTTLQGMIAGEFDSADTSPGPIFPAIAKGAPLKIIGSTSPRVTHVLYVKKDINDLKDLYGRSVGTGAIGAFLHVLASATMVKEGLDPDKVQWVNIGGSPDVFKAVVGGKVDAGVSSLEFEPEIPADSGVKLLFAFGPRLPNYINFAVLVSEKTLADKRDAVIAFATAYTQGHRWGVEHKDETIALAVKLTNGKSEVMSRAFDRYMSEKILDLNFYLSPEAIQFTQEMGVLQKQQEAVLPLERVATADIQREVVQALGEIKR